MSKKLLIVEDDKDLLINMIAFFEDEGYDCTGAYSAEDALVHLEDNLFDLAIVDIGLSHMSGDEFISLARARHQHLKFIIHTGQNSFQLSDELRSLEIHDRHVFRKPLLDFTPIMQELALLIG